MLLASYGLIRESFSDLAQHRTYGEGRYGEGAYGGGPTPTQSALVSIAIRFHLLPADGKLTLTDRKRNATFAISGTVVAALSLLAELIFAIIG